VAPLVNPGANRADWQVYDIVFRAPKFDGSTLVKPAYFTVFFNGVLVHDHQESMGPWSTASWRITRRTMRRTR